MQPLHLLEIRYTLQPLNSKINFNLHFMFAQIEHVGKKLAN